MTRPIVAALCAAFFAATPLVLAQSFSYSTLAGLSGVAGSTDGSGSAARFNSPNHVALDRAGNLYVTDATSQSVRKIDPAGVVTTLSAPGDNIAGLAVDADGNLFATDTTAHVIWKITPLGVASIFAGQSGVLGIANGTGSAARFHAPRGLAIDGSGNLFVADANNHTVRMITPAGVVSTVAGLPGVSGSTNGPAAAARFSNPTNIAVDAAGTLYVVDQSNHLVRKIAGGEVTTHAGGGSGWNGNVDGVGTAAYFSYAQGIALDAAGNVFVCDQGNRTLRRIAPDRTVTTVGGLTGVSGAADGVGTAARFSGPAGLAIDGGGHLYIADINNHTVRKGAFILHAGISIEPADRMLPVGQNTTFTVAATGTGPFAYRWQRKAASAPGFVNLIDEASYGGVATATLTVSGITAAMHGDRFRCLVENAAAVPAISREAVLSVQAAPTIVSAGSATFHAGRSGSFSVVATGVPTPTISVSGGQFPAWATLDALTGSITGTPGSPAGTTFSFTLSASNGVGSPATQSFTLTVQAPPVLPVVTVNGPTRLVGSPGATLLLSASVSGTAPLTYQWKRNGLPIPGATSVALSKPGMAFRDAGFYQLAATNAAGSVVSSAVFVHIAPAVTQVIAWGVESTIPAGLTSTVAIAAGGGHGLALSSGGSVVAWGSNTEGQCNVPAGLANVVHIAAGGSHSLALKFDGTVAAWGHNTSGQASVPGGLAGVVAVAAGSSHSLALKWDGTVVGWGANLSGESTPPPGLSGVIAVSAGDRHSLALKADGTVVGWGYFGGYQIPATLGNIVAIASGSSTNIAAKADGTVAIWGSTSWVGNVPVGLSDVVAVGLSYYQGVALKSNGTVVLWGENYNSPVPFPSNTSSVLAISANSSRRFALRDASADRAPTIGTSPASVSSNLGQGVTFTVQASAGTAALNYQWHRNGAAIAGATGAAHTIHGVTAADAGTYHVVVSNSLGSATSSTAQLTVNAAAVVSATTGGRYPLTVGGNLSLTLSSSITEGATVEWRRNGAAIPGVSGRTLAIANATLADGGYYQAIYNEGSGPVASGVIFVPIAPVVTQVVGWGGGVASKIPAGLDDAIAVSARGGNALALKADGSVVLWSEYSYSGTNVPAGLNNVVAVATGPSHYVALRADGTVVTWTGSSSSNPHTPPAGLANVVAIAAGTEHTLALRADGTVVSWGTENPTVVAVPAGLTNVKAVAAGDGFSLALRADGAVIGWGRNSNGQSTVPAGLGGVVAIAAGSAYSLALKADGTVVGWGYESSGARNVPAGLADVVAIAAGDSHASALKADGTVVTWGNYNSGYNTVPKPANLQQVFRIAAGSASFALRDATGDKAPLILAQPTGATAFLRQNANFIVTADTGTAPVAFQWRKDGIAIPGATGHRLIVSAATAASAGDYDVLVSNYLGSTASAKATLTVTSTLAVSASPKGRVVIPSGQPLTLTGTTALPGTVTLQWRRNGQPIAGATQANYSVASASWLNGGVYQLAATNGVGAAVSAPVFVVAKSPVQLRVWSSSSQIAATIPSGLVDVVAIAAGSDHSLVLQADGSVVAWGENGAGQSVVPAGLADVAAIAAGHRFSLALTGAGNVVTWGALNFTPADATDAVAIVASPHSSIAMALKADGRVIAWDANGVRTDVPPGLGRVVAIACGGSWRLALREDGTVVQWGDSSYSVVAVPAGLSDVVAVSAGERHRLALRADGTVVAWGESNSYGSLDVPPGLGGVMGVTTGSEVSLGLKADGSAVAWGNMSLAASVVAHRPLLAASFGASHALVLRDPSLDAAPTISAQPVGQSVITGQPVVLSVTAAGRPEPSYQWYFNGAAISGATKASYTIASASTWLGGTYSVAVTNALGTVFSDEVAVVVNASLSSRGLLAGFAHAVGGATTLFGTFSVEGSSGRTVLVRAVGPTLTGFGVAGVMPDPILTITNAGGTTLATNDNWHEAGNASSIGYMAAQAGAFALPAGSRDAAILRGYPPGTYHARVTGAAAGVALLQIYDDTAASSRLVYLAANAMAGSGGRAFIQGITLAAPATGRSYLVRALGPTLGRADALDDPHLAIFNSAGESIAANDNWAGAEVVAAAASVGAMPLTEGSKDAAVAFTPARAGAFTVQVGGSGGSTGVVLLEVFEVDAQRVAAISPAVVAPPQGAAVVAGHAVTFGAVAIGRPAPALQWLRDGSPIDGATQSRFTISAVAAGDAGSYTLRATNASGAAESAPAVLSIVTQRGTHLVVGPGYVPGSTATIQNTLVYSGTASSLGWKVTLPEGWSYVSSSAAAGDVAPAVGATGILEWAWSQPPASPVTFRYTVNVPASELGTKTIAATAIVRNDAEATTSVAEPGALPVDRAPPLHTADRDGNSRLDLSELTRVIELYNTRNGTTRTGAYKNDATGEDGFAGAPARGPSTSAILAPYHSADTGGATFGSPRDGALDLFELTRVIQLYNVRNGTVRTGQYRVQSGTEDGFAPGL